MPIKLEYIILNEFYLIIEYYSGNISIDDIIYFKETISKDKCYCSSYNILQDFREAIFLMDEKDLLKYIEFVKKSDKLIGNRKVAHLTSKPNEVVLITLSEPLKVNFPISTKIFSTINAALYFIDINLNDFKKIEEIINELKTRPNKDLNSIGD